MGFNPRMNGLEHVFEGAPTISLRVFHSQFLQMVGRPSVFSHHSLTNTHTPEEDNGYAPRSN
jgi:hypothetical protein